MQIEFAFQSFYRATLLEEISSPADNERVVYFPGASKRQGKDGLIVRVAPHAAEEWIGIFAFGYDPAEAISGLFGCPDARFLCVVSRGSGYMVRTDDYRAWCKIPSFPIQDVRVVRPAGLLVFVDLTRLTAYSAEGQAWQTDHLSWDGLRVVEADEKSIKGLAWDAPTQREVGFSVDLKSGRHVGGSSSEQA